MFNIIIMFIIIFYCNSCSAHPFLQSKDKYFISIEKNISSRKIKYLFNKKLETNNFVSEDFNLYFEYGLFEKITIGGKLLNNTFATLDNRINNNKYYLKKDNYFYTTFIKHQFYKQNNRFFSFMFGYNNKIKYNKILLQTLNNDIYESVFLKLSFAYQFENFIQQNDKNILAFTIKYNHQFNAFKDSSKFNINYLYRINLTSLLIFEYSFNYDIYKYFDNNIFNDFSQNKTAQKQMLKSLTLSKFHSISILSSVEFNDYFTFFTKYSLNIEKNNKIYYIFSIGFWFRNI